MCCEVASPRKDREASYVIAQEYGCLNMATYTWLPIQVLNKYKAGISAKVGGGKFIKPNTFQRTTGN